MLAIDIRCTENFLIHKHLSTKALVCTYLGEHTTAVFYGMHETSCDAYMCTIPCTSQPIQESVDY